MPRTLPIIVVLILSASVQGRFYFLVKLAFQVDRCFTHPRRFNQLPNPRYMQSGQFHFIDFMPGRSGTDVHRILQRQGHHVDNKFTAAFYIVQRILFATVLVIPGKSNHHHRWVTSEAIEKAEGSQVYCPVRVNRAYPGNRPWHDAALEWVMRQAMMLTGFVKHVVYAR